MIDYDTIPPKIRKALDRWANEGTPVGHFVTAVLENNLSDAVARADEDSLAALHSIVGYVYNELPSPCWGSPEKTKAWAKRLQCAW